MKYKTIKNPKTTKAISSFKRGGAIALFERNVDPDDIATQLGVSPSSVYRFIRKYKQTGKCDISKSSGRKPKTTKEQDDNIIEEVANNPFITSNEIKIKLKLKVTSKTIRNKIKKNSNFASYKAANKPFINDTNREIRVKWAQEHLNWSLSDWYKVLWSDESPYTFRSHSSKRVWRRPKERCLPRNTLGTVKHDKKINVWGCFSAYGIGNIVNIVGNMNAAQYISILDNNLDDSVRKAFPFKHFPYVFQHDNDPKHKAVSTKEHLKMYEITTMVWPSNSPDLNPIENLWAIIERKIANRHCNTEIELFETVKKAWESLDTQLLMKLINSMHDRCVEVIKNNGYMTKY